MTSWTAMVGPANLKADLVAQANALIVKALADPALKAALRRSWRNTLADLAGGDQGISATARKYGYCRS